MLGDIANGPGDKGAFIKSTMMTVASLNDHLRCNMK